jgi:hypothetical protein
MNRVDTGDRDRVLARLTAGNDLIGMHEEHEKIFVIGVIARNQFAVDPRLAHVIEADLHTVADSTYSRHLHGDRVRSIVVLDCRRGFEQFCLEVARAT